MTSSPASSSQSTILIADDDPHARAVLRSLLLPEGHRILEAENGAAALECAQADRPDLILLDVIMPEIDGFELCARLRSLPQLHEVPIILITSLNDRESRLRGLTVGAEGFLSKPFDHAELLAQVRTITRLNRYRRLLTERERYERLITLAPDGIALIDAAERLMLVNPALVRLLGASGADTLAGTPLGAILTPDGLERYRSSLSLLASADQPIQTEVIIRSQQGAQIAVEINLGRCTDIDGAVAQAIFRDITLRKQAEAQIQRQISQLTNLHAIGVAITASLDLHNTLDRLLDTILEHIAVDAASVLLLNKHTSLLEPVAARGARLPVGPHFLLRSDQGLAGAAFLTARPVAMPAFTKDSSRAVRDQVLAARFGSYFALPLRARGETQGVLELMRYDTFHPDHHWWIYVEALATQAAIAIHTASLFEQLQAANAELVHAYDATIEGWSRALDMRDHETEGHSVRVTDMTLLLAQHLRVDPASLDHIRRGALLHDIGKMGVPDRILLKPGPLSVEEWSVMRQHPSLAYEWLALIPFLHGALDIPYAHHEKWDGSGYPRGLKGEQIPLSARIFAVVDVWDALRSTRPYRAAWDDNAVLAYIGQLSGAHFDPKVAQAFIELLNHQQAP